MPHRHRAPLQELLTEAHSSLEIAETHALEPSLTLTATQLRNYLTTQSNVSTQLEAGESLEAIDSFLDAGLEALFRHDQERFSYPGQVTRLVRG